MSEKVYNVNLKAVMLDGKMLDPETQLLSEHVNNASIHVTPSEKSAIAAVSGLQSLIDSAQDTISSINSAVGEEASARQAADEELVITINGKVDTETFSSKVGELEAADEALQQAIAGKVSQNGTDRLMTALEGQKLEAYPEYSSVEQASGAKADSTTVSEALNDRYTKAEAEAMVDDKIASAVTSIWTLKGSVENMEELEAIESPAVGDVYSVGSSEYFWTGDVWEELGTSIDLSSYATKDYADNVVASEAAIARSAEQANASAIASEIENRAAADTTIDGKIDSEIARATAAENTLSGKVTANESAIAALNAGSDSEGSVAFAVKAESDRALAAEQANAAAITAEANSARAAEQANAAAILNEANARGAADAEILSSLETKVSTETFEAKVTEIENGISGKADVEYVNTALEAKADAETINTALAGKAAVGAYDSAVEELQTNINSEVSNRESAISSLNTKKVETALVNSTTGSRMLIFNEMDGGGSKVEHSISVKGDRLFCTYIGLNDSGTIGMPADNDVLGQIYAINTGTDSATGKKSFGLRLNLYKNRLCYFPAAGLGETSNDPNRELAVKADVDATKTSVVNISEANFAVLMNQIVYLQNQIFNLKRADVDVVTTVEGITDASKDVTINAAEVSNTTANITAKSVEANDLNVQSARLSITTTGDVSINNLESEGNLAKSVSNASISIHSEGDVVIKDSVIGQSGYNCIEVGNTTGVAKSLVIDNVHFTGTFGNNVISIFKMEDGAVVNISNCIFDDCSNPLRISNTNNVKLTVNLINCEFTKWDTGAYAGMILFQDYTSANADAVLSNNLFSPEKIKINIINCTHNGVKISAPANIADVCGSGNDQLVYVYADKGGGLVAYDQTRFPDIEIK